MRCVGNGKPIQPRDMGFVASFYLIGSISLDGLTCNDRALSKFATDGAFKEGPYADAITEFIMDWTCEAPESVKQRAAEWFLLESERAFIVACIEAGIDAEKLRSHLRSRRP